MPEFDPTDEQLKILAHPITESARIIAGPGTGKSATVVALLDQVLSEGGNPARIRLITFTRAATGELARKVANQPSSGALRPSTIHSFAISVLLQNPGMGGFPTPLRIADSWEQRWIVYETLKRRSGFRIKKLEELFRWMESNWQSLEPRETLSIPEEDRVGFLAFWQEHRGVYGYTVLSELPYRLREALQLYPDLKGIDLDALIVDEYQDLNACDQSVLRMLADRGCTIIATGDDDQSIYLWRHAAREGILEFPKDYPGSADYSLSLSIRCGINLIRWANHVIRTDTSRPREKPVLRSRQGTPAGETALLSFSNHEAEARGAARLVRSLIDIEHVPESEIIVLIRHDHNRAFSNLLKPEFRAANINITDPSAVVESLADPGNRELVALLRLLCDRRDSLAWASIYKLTDGVGVRFLDEVYDRARRANSSFGEIIFRLASIDFADIPSRSAALKRFRQVTEWTDRHEMPLSTPEEGWGAWIISLADEEAETFHLTEYFRAMLMDLDQMDEEDTTLNRFVSRIEPIGKDLAQSKSEGVRIMTMAASKGLTVTATIVVGVEKGIIPHSKADREEESRLLYVAMTRATRYLYLTWARQRWGQSAQVAQTSTYRRPSPFLDDGPVMSEDGNSFLRHRFP